MILNRLLLIITFCLVVINAFVIDFGSNKSFAIRDPWDGDVFVKGCKYYTESKFILCPFEKEKYNKKKLIVQIPVTDVTGGEFTESDRVSSTINYVYNKKSGKFRDTEVLATTSPWEVIEAGDSYDVPEKSKIEVAVFTAYEHRDIYLHYKNLFVVKNNFGTIN